MSICYKDLLHIPNEELIIYYDNEPKMIINKAFLDKQNCWENLEEIKETFWLKFVFYELLSETKNKKMIKSLVQDLTEIEFKIQELFNFEPNIKFFRFWEQPGCLCPSMDNRERWPTGNYIIDSVCPLHGDV